MFIGNALPRSKQLVEYRFLIGAQQVIAGLSPSGFQAATVTIQRVNPEHPDLSAVPFLPAAGACKRNTLNAMSGPDAAISKPSLSVGDVLAFDDAELAQYMLRHRRPDSGAFDLDDVDGWHLLPDDQRDQLAERLKY